MNKEIYEQEIDVQKKEIKKKQRARRFALQALYQWLMTKESVSEIEAQFRSQHDMEKVDGNYFCLLLHGVLNHLSTIEENIKPFLDRPITSLNPIELTIIRLGTFELLYSLEVPYRVILDETIVLAKEFGSQDGYRYVNGVLHGLAQCVRKLELIDHG